jgi:hypothetical protein
VVGAALDAYHYSYPPVLLLLLLLLLTTPLRSWPTRRRCSRAGGGLVRFLSRTASGDAGPRRAGGLHCPDLTLRH